LKKKQKKLNSSSKFQNIDPVSPQAGIIDRAGEIISNGGVVIFPTTGLYGLGADAMNEDAVRKVYEIKKRPPDNPILVLVKNQEALKKIAVSLSPAANAIINNFWPGNVTIIFEAQNNMPSITTAGTGKIGIRIPAHNVAMALTKRVEYPVTATSANISNTAGCSKISDISPEIIDQADLILDAGNLKGGMGSTVVDVTTSPPEILREGTIAAVDILSCV